MIIEYISHSMITYIDAVFTCHLDTPICRQIHSTHPLRRDGASLEGGSFGVAPGAKPGSVRVPRITHGSVESDTKYD
ncbi:MAG: hypothetical protein HQ508_03310 [Candidatus Marinimicrobia bacterium]|nr:hypothetical protein [Candidatus Neomarinimicrobiota bacterium]